MPTAQPRTLPPHGMDVLPPVGMRVRLLADVERFADGVAPAGALGTVTTSDAAPCRVGVTLDAPPEWLAPWDGEVLWAAECVPDDLAPRPGTDAWRDTGAWARALARAFWSEVEPLTFGEVEREASAARALANGAPVTPEMERAARGVERARAVIARRQESCRSDTRAAADTPQVSHADRSAESRALAAAAREDVRREARALAMTSRDAGFLALAAMARDCRERAYHHAVVAASYVRDGDCALAARERGAALAQDRAATALAAMAQGLVGADPDAFDDEALALAAATPSPEEMDRRRALVREAYRALDKSTRRA